MADSGYFSEANVKMTMEEGIDAYSQTLNPKKRIPDLRRWTGIKSDSGKSREHLWVCRFVPAEPGFHDE